MAQYEPNLSETSHAQAAQRVIKDYLDGIAQIIANKVQEGLTLAVLSGPVNQAVIRYVNQHDGDFQPLLLNFKKLPTSLQTQYAQQSTFEKIMLGLVWPSLSGAAKAMFQHYQFSLVTDINIANNTTGASKLLTGQMIGQPLKNNWLSIKP